MGSCVRHDAACPEFELAQVCGIVPGDSITTGVHARGTEEYGIAEELKCVREISGVAPHTLSTNLTKLMTNNVQSFKQDLSIGF